MAQLTSACCQIWLSLIRERYIFKLKHLENSKYLTKSNDKLFSHPKIATLDKIFFSDFKGSPLLCQPNPENMAKSAVALHVSSNLCLKDGPLPVMIYSKSKQKLPFQTSLDLWDFCPDGIVEPF